MEESTELYTCSRTARDSEIPPEWDPDGAGGSGAGAGGKKTNITVPQVCVSEWRESGVCVSE